MRAFIRKSPAQKFGKSAIVSHFFGIFIVLFVFYFFVGSSVLPGTQETSRAYVSRMWKERTNASKGPDYRYYIVYVDEEGRREESEVSAIIYKRVTPILGRLYVTRGKNVFGDTVTRIGLSKKEGKVEFYDIAVAMIVIGCFVGATYIHYGGYRKKKTKL